MAAVRAGASAGGGALTSHHRPAEARHSVWRRVTVAAVAVAVAVAIDNAGYHQDAAGRIPGRRLMIVWVASATGIAPEPVLTGPALAPAFQSPGAPVIPEPE